MAFTYLDLQTEIKRRGVRGQSGTQFDVAVQNLINTSLFRITREALWRVLRRQETFDTEGEYTTGTISATNGSASFTSSSVNLITNNIQVGRRIDVQGSTRSFIIATITGENAFTTDKTYDGTTASSLTYTIYGKEEYNLPIQTGRPAFLWHEQFGYPYVLRYVPTMTFYDAAIAINVGDIPTHYRMWGEDDIIEQPTAGSVITISSSDSGDTAKAVTVYGIVSDYPDFEVITTDSSDGTTTSAGSKSFTKVERITKDSSTDGRITATSNSANVTIAVLPVGDSTGRLQYKKIQVHPLPTAVFPVHAMYYKELWRLVRSGDFHELGQEFDEAIILLCVAKIKYENSQKEGDRWIGLYKDEIRTLKKTNADKLDFLPTLKRPSQGSSSAARLHSQVAYTQLGGFFGPMSSA